MPSTLQRYAPRVFVSLAGMAASVSVELFWRAALAAAPLPANLWRLGFWSTVVFALFAFRDWKLRRFTGLIVSALSALALYLASRFLPEPFLLVALYGCTFGAPGWTVTAFLVRRFGSSPALPDQPEALHKFGGTADAKFNVVFIHGVHGDYVKTWSADETKENSWPQWIASSFPEAAVYSLQYNAFVTSWKGVTMPLVDRASNLLNMFDNDRLFRLPTIFIVHSYGGLAVKQVWRLIEDTPRPDAKKAIREVIFLATPHVGSDLGGFLRHIFPDLLSQLTVTANELRFGDAALRNLNTWYRQHPIPRNHIYFETDPIPFIGKAVDAVSADPGLPGANPVPISSNHMTICKPSSRDAQIAKAVARHLEEFRDSLARETVAARRPTLPPGIDATPANLLLQIRSGNADVVRLLLEAGVQANIRIDGQTALRVALEQIGPDAIPAPGDPGVAVIAALIEAGRPRDLAAEAHAALDQGRFGWLIALRRAGLPVEARNPSGDGIFVRSLRKLEGDWLKQFVSGPPLPGRMAAWALLCSARRGDLELVRALIANGASPHARLDDAVPEEKIVPEESVFWPPGGTALHIAAASDSENSVRLAKHLLQNGADPSAADQIGNTSLHRAVEARDRQLVEALIAAMKPGQMNAKNQAGQSPLGIALGHHDLMRMLIRSGASASGENALLHRAVYEGDAASLEILLDAGGDMNAVEEGRTPLISKAAFWPDWRHNVDSGHLRCCKILLDRGADVNLTDSSGDSALHHLAVRDNLPAVELLLSHGARVDASNRSGGTPLMRCNSDAIAALLLKHGANPNVRDRSGYTPLDWAVMHGREEVATVVAAAGGEAGRPGEARLVAAVAAGDHSLIRELLTAGIDPNTRDGYAHLVLHAAAGAWDVESVKLLLDSGGDPSARDSNEGTALAAALHARIDNLDLERMADTAELLLQYGAPVQKVDGRGNPLAHIGLLWWHEPRLASRILALGANQVNHEGVTLLMVAVEYGTVEQMRQLLAGGAEVNAVDHRGRNCLFRRHRNSDENLARAQLLLDAGARVDCTDKEGQTPLSAAAAAGDARLVRLLIEHGAIVTDIAIAGALRHGQVEMVNHLIDTRAGARSG